MNPPPTIYLAEIVDSSILVQEYLVIQILFPWIPQIS